MTRRWLGRAIKGTIGLAASARSFDRPIFILAPPRSGSTFLFDCLCWTNGVFHLPTEADAIWWRLFPYQDARGFSDHLSGADVGSSEALTLCRLMYQEALLARLRTRLRLIDLRHLFGRQGIRYLDKTIANCFHLDVLDGQFPDAHFVFLVRDPRANIASMIEGWPYVGRFGKKQLTPVLHRLQPRTIEHWAFPAPPGWQAVVSRPLAEICAWSWRQHVETVLKFFERRSRPLIRVTYEQLTHDPAHTVRRLADDLQLSWSTRAEAYARAAPLSRTVVSKPDRDKWRLKHATEIERLLPMISQTAARVGYDLAREPAG
jgi:hypothetical protein